MKMPLQGHYLAFLMQIESYPKNVFHAAASLYIFEVKFYQSEEHPTDTPPFGRLVDFRRIVMGV